MSATNRARSLRKNATPSEKRLWSHLRDRRLAGYKFRRQQPVGPYIIDLFCPDARVIIELDGESHIGKERYDVARTQWLEANGYKVLRIWDSELFNNSDKIIEMIYEECKLRVKPDEPK